MPASYNTNPTWWARFYTWGRPSAGILCPVDQVIEIGSGRAGGDIISFNTEKGITSTGGFTITMVPHRTINYLRHIPPNSPCELWVDNGTGLEPQMFAGFVDRISKTRSVGEEGGVTHRIQIHCRDATKIFQNLAIFYYPSLRNIQAVMKTVSLLLATVNSGSLQISRTGDTKGSAIFRPIEFIWSFMFAYMPGILDTDAVGLDFNVPDPDRTLRDPPIHFLDIIDKMQFVHDFTFFKYVKFAFNDRNFGTAENLWSLIQRYSHSMLNETFLDTRPASEIRGFKDFTAKVAAGETDVNFVPNVSENPEVSARYSEATVLMPYFGLTEKSTSTDWAIRLIHRPRPYLCRDFLSLPRHELEASEIIEEDIGLSDHDVKNYFRVGVNFLGKQLDVLSMTKLKRAIIHADSMIRNGLRRMEPSSDFVWSAGSVSVNIASNKPQTEVIQEQTEIIAKQHYRNERLLNGTLTTSYVRPDLRIGNALRYRDRRTQEDLLFYIENVSHNGSVEGKTQTQLSLVRGLPFDEAQRGEDDIQLDPTPSNRGLRYIKLGEKLPRGR